MLLFLVFFVFSLCNNMIQSEETPKQIHILFRHGERSPTTTYQKDPHKNYKWNGVGYLTNQGKSQMFSLGQNVRAHYENFLPRYYWPVEANFTSSPWDRCLMSAQLFAAGLFPPQDFQIWNPDFQWQPIPVHYLPRNCDNFKLTQECIPRNVMLLDSGLDLPFSLMVKYLIYEFIRFVLIYSGRIFFTPSCHLTPQKQYCLLLLIYLLLAMKRNCTKYEKQFIEVQNSAKVQQYNQDYAELYNYLSQHTGSDINNIDAVESLFSTLEIYQLNNLSTPHWINDTLMGKMKIIAAQNLAIYSETEYMKKMKGGFFLKTILDLMKAALNGTKDVPTINSYSAHDLTIVHVMRALNLIDTLKPYFGASLIFELYEDSTIKVFYWNKWNGEIIEQILPNCASPCTVSKFNEGYKAVLPLNWAQECQL